MVAFPLVAAVAEGEGVAHHHVHGFGGGAGALEERGEIQVADLDGGVGGDDVKVAGDADRFLGGGVEAGEEERSVRVGQWLTQAW